MTKLSDLIRICEDSPLWPMTMSADGDEWVLFWGGDAFESGLVGAFVTFTVEPSGSASARLGFDATFYSTAGALRDALDAVHREMVARVKENARWATAPSPTA